MRSYLPVMGLISPEDCRAAWRTLRVRATKRYNRELRCNPTSPRQRSSLKGLKNQTQKAGRGSTRSRLTPVLQQQHNLNIPAEY